MNRPLSGGGLRRSLLAIVSGLLLAGIVMQLSGYHPGEAYTALWTGGTGLQSGAANGPNDLALGAFHLSKNQFADSLYYATPLLFAGLAIALGLRAGLFNIGAQGQMLVGALAAAVMGLLRGLPPIVHVPLTLLAGALAGALWGAIPGLLKALRGVHEVIVTIMLNFVALNLAEYLTTHNLKDTAANNMAPQTSLIARSAWLNPLIPNSNLTLGLFLAIFAAVAMTFLIRRAALGYEIRAVGQGTEAARAAGISVTAILVKTMALSGALAGLAGAVEVMGVHHRYVGGLAGSYGFDGIAVALLGGLNGGGVALSALFFGALENGARYMQLMTNVPDSIATIVQAFVIIFIGIRLHRQRAAKNPTLATANERQGANAGV